MRRIPAARCTSNWLQPNSTQPFDFNTSSNLNISMIPASQISAASNAKSYNSTTSGQKRSKDGATMTPHSGKYASKVSQSFGKKRCPLMNREVLRITLEGKETVEITGNLPGYSRDIVKAALKERRNIRSCSR